MSKTTRNIAFNKIKNNDGLKPVKITKAKKTKFKVQIYEIDKDHEYNFYN